ncbi:MAG: phytoene/squalene synthase family protein [Sphingobacteriales bacterium]|nr:MAG: phytoene/squalene synthase family protein [Sphingobacteriales bacterium]
MHDLYASASAACSREIARHYSTSFFSAINLLDQSLRGPVCNVYGFVRVADEIVDTFHEQDKKALLDRFTADTWEAIAVGFSTNPILHAYAQVARQYAFPEDLTQAFLRSMALDLEKKDYETVAELDEYIYGSAEVVGLMCLCIFVAGDRKKYEALKPAARRLGAAFQKINFLRDLKADYEGLERSYFPDLDFRNFDRSAKAKIEADIAEDFKAGVKGIRRLPDTARLGVYIAYRYYLALFRKIRDTPPEALLLGRIRVPDSEKLLIATRARWRWLLGKV